MFGRPRPFKLLMIEYTDLSVVTESLNNFITLIQLQGEKSVQSNTIHTFEDSKGKFSSVASMDELIIVVFFLQKLKRYQNHV